MSRSPRYRRIAHGIALATCVVAMLLASSSVAMAENSADDGLITRPVPGQRWDAVKVFIDPGHGGPYSNANANGLREKTVNLWLGLELRRQLQAKGYPVGMTRTTDRAVCTKDIPTWHWTGTQWTYRKDGRVPMWPPTDDLQARANLANAAGADVFISIHNNGVSSSAAQGTETYATPDDDLGRSLSRYVQQAMIEQTGMRNRGYHSMNFYVIRWANMPAILIEGGFLTSPHDAKLLRSATFRSKLVRGMIIGFERWLKAKPFHAVYSRIKGRGAEQVSVSVSKAAWAPSPTTVVLASATDPSHAYGAATLSHALNAPVLLVNGNSLDASTAAEVTRLGPDKIVVLGPESSVGTTLVAGARDAAGLLDADVRRIAGAEQYETAALIAEEVGLGSGTVVISPGGAPSEAISGGLYAGMKGAPLLLTAPGSTLSASTKAYLTAHAGSIKRVVVVGRHAGVSDAAVAGLPSVSRIDGEDGFGVNTGTLRKLFPSGTLKPLVVSRSRPAEMLAAEVLAVKQHRPLVITGGRLLSPLTRLWISNFHAKVSSWTLVGGYSTQPLLMDWLVHKAAH